MKALFAKVGGWLVSGGRWIWAVLAAIACIAVPVVGWRVEARKRKRVEEDLRIERANAKIAREAAAVDADAANRTRKTAEDLLARIRELRRKAYADDSRFRALREELASRVGADEAAKIWRETFDKFEAERG